MSKSSPCPETLAIVEATFAALTAQQAALTLRMWHHLLPYPERDALFADYPGSEGAVPLVQSFLAAASARVRGGWPQLHQAGRLRPGDPLTLEQAFGRAVGDVLGQVGVPMVIRAWREMMGAFLGELCRDDPAPIA